MSPRSGASTSTMAVIPAAASILFFIVTMVHGQEHNASSNAQPVPLSAIFQFGDSLSDAGNFITLYPEQCVNYCKPPYGMTFFKHPTGRVCDGRLLIDFLASELGLPFLNPSLRAGNTSYLQGANFAVLGSAALSLDFFKAANMSHIPRPVTLETQVQWFRAFQQNAATDRLGLLPNPKKFSQALYVVGEIGGDDYWAMIQSGISYKDLPKFVPHVIGAIERALKDLYAAGPRNFLVMNIPLGGCNPYLVIFGPEDEERDEFGCLEAMNRLTAVHRSMLQSMVERLRIELPDASISIGDYYGASKEIIRNFQLYNFKHRIEACCGIFKPGLSVACGATKVVNGTLIRGEACENPSEFIFWNDNHFTEEFYKVVAAAFLSGRFIDPPNALHAYYAPKLWNLE